MSPLVLIVTLLAIVLVALVLLVLINRGEARFTFDIGGATPRASGGGDTSTEKGFKNRLTGLSIFSGSIIGLLFARLWAMQLVSADEYARQAELNRTRTVSTAAPRGRILDRNGVELVNNRPSLVVTASTEVVDSDVEVQLLANVLGMPPVAVRRKIQDQTEGAQSLRTVAVDVSRRVVSYIDEHQYLFEGVKVEERAQRHYPLGSRCAHVLGYTGRPTQEQLAAAKEDTSDARIPYESDDTVGQAGIEYQYESVLQGVRGEQQLYVDADGNVLDYATSIEAQSGSDIILTIDNKVQEAAEQALVDAIARVRKTGNLECSSGSAVCMDVTNGEIIALASHPTFSPNDFVGGISNDDWDMLSSEEAGNPLMNRVIAGQYPSASTIKPLSAFAALNYGIASMDSHYVCTGYWTGFGEAYGQYCWQHEGHGTVNLREGIVYSCDTVFYEIGKAFFYSDDKEGLQETYRRWGLGSALGIDLPAESVGRVPDPDWKWNYFTQADDYARSWQGGDTTNLVIGQGDMLVTPLQMACVYAGLATRGSIMRPHVLKGVASHAGDGTVIDFKSEPALAVEEEGSSFDLVADGLKGVIYEESEAQASHFTNMRELVAGKTGTAERTGEEPTGWFIAFVPADDPKYVVASCVEQGGFGSECAMYVVRDIMGAIYDEPDTSTAVDSSGVR
ncbi:MAG: penicillin-binding protein 2 [Acidobacteriota bacterium]|nr:penicillin-binding protein 2 [Acidobacteriota bacterium]